jgi:plasmid stabilization system protein ParE
MSYAIEYLQKARTELIEAWEWYEDRQLGLGDKFKAHIDNCIKSIEQHPERYPERRKHYREGAVKTFPYLLIYRVHKKKKVIVIASVFHTRRHPNKKH